MNPKKLRNLDSIRSFKENTWDVPNTQVTIVPCITSQEYPVVFQSRDKYVVVGEWLKNNKEQVREQLYKSGAVLLRGFNMEIANSFREVVNSYGKEVIEYDLGAARRTKEIDNIYLSTHHPAGEDLEMHNEMSYAANWPTEIMLYCDIPATEGGETPLCDGRKIWSMLKEETRNKFERLSIMYVRQLGGLFGGLTWQKVFQTDDRSIAEEKCRETNMEFEWMDNDVFRMKWVKPAVISHPGTNEVAWFNHSFFFNSFMLNPDIRQTMKVEDIPFYSYYGDGSEIEQEVLQELDAAFKSTKASFIWEKGDMLLVDNILLSHGRNSFKGDRKVLVAMFRSIY
jgi:alpha-ketoglutarate-dependent taurine dioxygenase